MNNPDKIRSSETYESIYSSELFVDLANIILAEHDRQNVTADASLQFYAVWYEGKSTKYTLERVFASSIEETGEACSTEFMLCQYKTDAPHEELVAEYITSVKNGGEYKPIISVGDDSDTSQAKAVRESIGILTKKAKSVSPYEVGILLQDESAASFKRLIGNYVLNDLIIENEKLSEGGITETDAILAADTHQVRISEIHAEQYGISKIPNTDKTVEEQSVGGNAMHIAIHTRPKPSDHGAPYMEKLDIEELAIKASEKLRAV